MKCWKNQIINKYEIYGGNFYGDEPHTKFVSKYEYSESKIRILRYLIGTKSYIEATSFEEIVEGKDIWSEENEMVSVLEKTFNKGIIQTEKFTSLKDSFDNYEIKYNEEGKEVYKKEYSYPMADSEARPQIEYFYEYNEGKQKLSKYISEGITTLSEDMEELIPVVIDYQFIEEYGENGELEFRLEYYIENNKLEKTTITKFYYH